MHWQVRYYDGKLPLRVVSSDAQRVTDLDTKGIIDITVTSPDGYRIKLVGADSYYLIPGTTRFGLFNDDGSGQHFLWSEEDGFVQVDQPEEIPYLLYGILMPDNEAQQIGLI